MEKINGKRLRIYLSEKDHYQHKPLYEWIVHTADELKMAGVTVLRGIEGFGAHHHIHTVKLLRFSIELPIIIEVVDNEERIEEFLGSIEKTDCQFLSTLEPVEIRQYGTTQEA